ncbi:hypothetical protein M569_12337, partial [Genlisea aurea]
TSLLSIVCVASLLTAVAESQTGSSTFELAGESVDPWESTLSFYGGDLADQEMTADQVSIRRSLYWKGLFHYYISYGALSANRIPCPPRSGRSYYTHNCYRARGSVHPYSRGCSAITHCRR